MNAPANLTVGIKRAGPDLPIFAVTGRETIAIRAGTAIACGDIAIAFETETPVPIAPGALFAGCDLFVYLSSGGALTALAAFVEPEPGMVRIGGFHFAPGGNASGRSGGDDIPAINPYSCWDAGFRPACSDPRGMTLVTLLGGDKVWVDIYKLGVDHLDSGTSRFGAVIADGDDPPQRVSGDGYYDRLDYPTAVKVYAHHGKQLLTYDEFRAAAFGVTEKSAAGRDPKKTGLDAARTSRLGVMQATGNLWDWGTDGDPDDPRPSIFGGSWVSGSLAGSRFADLGLWPGLSLENISARGRSDHLSPE